MKVNAIKLAVPLALLAFDLEGITISPEELGERRNWVVARFEGRQPPPRTDPALVLFASLDEPQTPRQFTGRELMERGLPITLPDTRSSGLLTYRRLAERK